LEFRIQTLPALEIVGKVLETSMHQGRVFQDIPEFWERCDGDGTTAWLAAHKGPLGVLGASLDVDNQRGIFRYHASIEAPAGLGELPEGFVRRTIPASQWGIFEDHGPLPLILQMLIRDVHTSWLPSSSEWALAGTFNVVRYPTFPQGTPRAGDGHVHACELWIPLRPKDTGRS